MDILRNAKNFEIAGFIDSNQKFKDKNIDGVKIFGDKDYLDILWKKGVKAGIVAIGDNKKDAKLPTISEIEILNLLMQSIPKPQLRLMFQSGTM